MLFPLRLVMLWLLFVLSACAAAGNDLLEVGVAKIDITPMIPVRLQGFPHRGRQEDISEVSLPIQAQAIAFGSDAQKPVILVAVGLLGVSEGMKQELLERLDRRLGFDDPVRLTLTATHTHSAPALADVAPYIFRKPPTEEQAGHIAEYRAMLMNRLEKLVLSAMANRRPSQVSLRRGTLDFAVNRRELENGVWSGFGDNPSGPVDHEMPMLSVTGVDGALRAVWLNYACHGVNWLEPSVHGDWMGVAQNEIEASYPGVVAIVTIGCAGDQNPTGITDNKAKEHGHSVALEVERLLSTPGQALSSLPLSRLRKFDLPLGDRLPVELWENQDHWYAEVVGDWLAQGKALPSTLPYVLQTWKFGEDLSMVFLAGEVVMDYAVRLKRDSNDARLWITAYANDAPAYIPSARMVESEGGYEVDGSRMTYGVPARLAPESEDLIVSTALDLLADDQNWWANNGHPRGAWWKNNNNYKGAEAEEIWKRIKLPPAPIRTPEAALETFLAPDGFRIELVAAEPLITRPVFMRFDAAGRLWVVEMNGYMRDVDATGAGDASGRVVVLEDQDGDGRMDKATTFMEGLVMPRSLAFVTGGVLVVEPPNIWYARDTNGDLVADTKSMVADDYGNFESPEHSANGLMHSMDNWMYSAKSAVRYRFNQGKLVGDSTVFRGQWGIAQDDGGRLYYNYNSSPLHADLVPGPYPATIEDTVRPPRANGETPLLVNVSIADDFSLFPAHLTPLVTLGASDLREEGTLKKYSAACGPLIYRGDLFPAAYRGNAFVCEPVGNLIGRFVIQGGVSSLTAKVAREEDREFLVSTDERFRPVHLETGPEGALYIADMYTGIIEHRMYVTEYLRNQLIERGFNQFTETGRIYRLVPDNATPPKPIALSNRSKEDWVSFLASSNGWVRDTAQRLLVESGDRSVLPTLRNRVKNDLSALGRLHALWTCEGLSGLDESTLFSALADPDLRVRSAAVRLGKTLVGTGGPDFTGRFRAMADDGSLEVRLQLMLSLEKLEMTWAQPLMADLLAKGPDPLLGSTALAALHGSELPFMRHVLTRENWAEADPVRIGVLKIMSQQVLQRKRLVEIKDWLEALSSASPNDWRVAAILDGAVLVKARGNPVSLAAKPALFEALQASGRSKDLTILAALNEILTWPGNPALRVREVSALSDEQQKLFKEGEATYAQICIACHQADGEGLVNVAPSLVGSRRAEGSAEAVIRIVLHGLRGGDFAMAGLGSIPGLLNDEKIAGVLTYVRRAWGNTADPISPRQVAQVRAATGNRTQPWTEAELEAWLK